jgi:hypothetical protein
VPDGIYYPADEGGNKAWTVNQTQVWQIVDQGMCDCPTGLYEVNFGFAATACSACCFPTGSQNLWSDTATVAPGSNLYFDAEALSPVGAGFWSDNTNVFETDGSGLVIGSSSCSACTCGDTSDITLTFLSHVPGHTGTLALEKSFDLHSWFPVGQVTFLPTDPIGVPISATFQVEQNAWTRTVSSSDLAIPGAMYLEYLVDNVTIDATKTLLPATEPIVLTARDQATPGPLREYKTTVFPI